MTLFLPSKTKQMASFIFYYEIGENRVSRYVQNKIMLKYAKVVQISTIITNLPTVIKQEGRVAAPASHTAR